MYPKSKHFRKGNIRLWRCVMSRYFAYVWLPEGRKPSTKTTLFCSSNEVAVASDGQGCFTNLSAFRSTASLIHIFSKLYFALQKRHVPKFYRYSVNNFDITLKFSICTFLSEHTVESLSLLTSPIYDHNMLLGLHRANSTAPISTNMSAFEFSLLVILDMLGVPSSI